MILKKMSTIYADEITTKNDEKVFTNGKSKAINDR